MIQRKSKTGKGFTLIEVLIGLALMWVAVMGLAELFTLAVLQNRQADRIANATFLAQQEIDTVRNMLLADITAMAGNTIDESINLNGDVDAGGNEIYDYRRITQVLYHDGVAGPLYDVKVFVFSAEHMTTPQDDLIALIADPEGRNKARAQIQTMIWRQEP
ncbi:MAG: prepilin-type N-terminal cleavage/methylation domain-containing protein [Candidatus Aminicenantes bacterium]|nr:prepilin-type N-terminal cleavage/methylation domain-containing protein [Candidatus Aminicenantes bacterium]